MTCENLKKYIKSIPWEVQGNLIVVFVFVTVLRFVYWMELSSTVTTTWYYLFVKTKAYPIILAGAIFFESTV